MVVVAALMHVWGLCNPLKVPAGDHLFEAEFSHCNFGSWLASFMLRCVGHDATLMCAWLYEAASPQCKLWQYTMSEHLDSGCDPLLCASNVCWGAVTVCFDAAVCIAAVSLKHFSLRENRGWGIWKYGTVAG